MTYKRADQTVTLRSLLAGGAALLALTLPASAQDVAPHTTSTTVSAMLGEPADAALNQALESRITAGDMDSDVTGEFSAGVARGLRHAYAQGNFAPIWSRDGALSLKAAARNLRDHGIIAEDVFERDLDDLIDQRFSSSPDSRADADIALTLAALRAGRALSAGFGDEGGMDTPSTTGAMRSNLTDYLKTCGQGGCEDALSALAPTHPQYMGLQSALREYKALKREGGWARIPDGDLIEVGDTDPRVSALRTRLQAEGFEVPASATPDLYDAGLEAALKVFQKRHGLETDGVVGGNTLEALNESVSSKIARIADTLHRWRRHGDMGERYVLANIPSFTAEGWNGGRREIRMKTVVGSPRHATPTFSDEIEYIVANPKWFVPTSIARRQKLSKLQADASYAPANNYQVIDKASGEAVSSASVDWNAPDVLSRYRLVQGPGPNNALGQLKIIFPNQYAVYLHDTPTQHLFDEAKRAFSSGCVRLEDPEGMARWVASVDPDLTPEEVSAQLDSGERDRLYLDRHVPVHITYHTVTVNDAGEPVFHRDVYDRLEDVEMAEKLASLG